MRFGKGENVEMMLLFLMLTTGDSTFFFFFTNTMKLSWFGTLDDSFHQICCWQYWLVILGAIAFFISCFVNIYWCIRKWSKGIECQVQWFDTNARNYIPLQPVDSRNTLTIGEKDEKIRFVAIIPKCLDGSHHICIYRKRLKESCNATWILLKLQKLSEKSLLNIENTNFETKREPIIAGTSIWFPQREYLQSFSFFPFLEVVCS